jgi:hypothetical protein
MLVVLPNDGLVVTEVCLVHPAANSLVHEAGAAAAQVFINHRKLSAIQIGLEESEWPCAML